MEEKIFGIISYAGDARGIAYEALDKAEAFEFEKAEVLLKDANENLKKAHRFQTEMIQEEAKGNKVETNIILIHAQDHLMTAVAEINLIERFIRMYKKLSER